MNGTQTEITATADPSVLDAVAGLNGFSLHPITPFITDLRATLENERQDLDAGSFERLGQFAAEKMHALEQINLIAARSGTDAMPESMRAELGNLKQELEGNMQLLDIRIRAINEMTETIQAAIDDAESDGTYQAGQFRMQS